MTRLRTLAVIPALALFLTACPADPVDPADPPDNDNDEVAVCLQGDPFVADGAIPVDVTPNGDADEVQDIRWEDHSDCERLVIDVGIRDDGEASSPGEVEAELLRDLGVVRVTLRDVEWADFDLVEQTGIGGTLASAAYIVGSAEGSFVFVDVHLGSAAEAHVATLQDPARVVVDLRPGGAELPEPAATNDLVVVLQPRGGEHAYPLEVTGYARTVEANVVIRLEHDGQDVHEDFTTSTGWVDYWGYYAFTVDEGPSGEVTLHVGERSAHDGTWQGAEVQLTMQ